MRLHVAVVAHLTSQPDYVLGVARKNLERWIALHGPQPYYTEWLEILRSRSAEEIAALLLADDDQGQHLRQTAPFPGVLTERERSRALRGA